MPLYVGLMSGTSLDGVDGVLASFDAAGRLQVLGHAHRPYPTSVRDTFLSLNAAGHDELHRSALAANAHAELSASVVRDLMDRAAIAAPRVRAIGSHGQTVRHHPASGGATGYSLQLNNGALLAEATGIDVICDFRSRDIAAGGQGAPLVPAFHAAVFARKGVDAAVLNLGGIANLTLLPSEGSVIGFDCGPANALLDEWCQRHTGRPFDEGGRWGATGQVLPGLLASLLREPYLHLPPPKSTGRDLFHLRWLAPHLSQHASDADPRDVQATLAEYTAAAAAQHLIAHAPSTTEILVCGGGSLNADLMTRLQHRLPRVRVAPTDERGLPAMQVEAAAFAWLAHAFCEHRPGNLVAVTGARGPRVLGALYPAG